MNRCAPFKDIMQRAVIAELTDLDPGIPSGLIPDDVSADDLKELGPSHLTWKTGGGQ